MDHIQKLGLKPGAEYEFEYTNHAGETEKRHIQFIDAEFGMVEPYYPTPRLLFNTWCFARQAYRSFDPAKINFATWKQLSVSYGE